MNAVCQLVNSLKRSNFEQAVRDFFVYFHGRRGLADQCQLLAVDRRRSDAEGCRSEAEKETTTPLQKMRQTTLVDCPTSISVCLVHLNLVFCFE